jgi:hypothetical protein
LNSKDSLVPSDRCYFTRVKGKLGVKFSFSFFISARVEGRELRGRGEGKRG